MLDHKKLIGLQAMETNKHGEDVCLGVITDSYLEGSVHYIVLNGEWETNISSCEEVMDLINGGHYIRVRTC